MILENSSFRFKKFELTQEHAAMKIGTDGVLLGAWANIDDSQTFMDVGAGTGVVGLMIAQRHKEAKGIFLEPDGPAFTDLKYNITHSPFSNRLVAINESFQEYNRDRVDHIISNPPYFLAGNTAEGARGQARHAQALTYPEILIHADRHLNGEGGLTLILPFQEGGELIGLAPKFRFFLKRHCTIYPNISKPPIRRLIEFSRKLGKVEHSELYIRRGANLSPEFLHLTKDFYLNGSGESIA